MPPPRPRASGCGCPGKRETEGSSLRGPARTPATRAPPELRAPKGEFLLSRISSSTTGPVQAEKRDLACALGNELVHVKEVWGDFPSVPHGWRLSEKSLPAEAATRRAWRSRPSQRDFPCRERRLVLRNKAPASWFRRQISLPHKVRISASLRAMMKLAIVSGQFKIRITPLRECETAYTSSK